MMRPVDPSEGVAALRRLPASLVGGILLGTTLCVGWALTMVGVPQSAEPLTTDVRVVTVFQQPAASPECTPN